MTLEPLDASASSFDASPFQMPVKPHGRIRSYLNAHPHALDAVVILSYLVLVTPTIIDAGSTRAWPAALILLLDAGALLLRRAHPIGLVAFGLASTVVSSVFYHGVNSISTVVWFGLYAVATSRNRRLTLAVTGLVTAAMILIYILTGHGPATVTIRQENPADFQLQPVTGDYGIGTALSNVAGITMTNLLAAGLGGIVRQRRLYEEQVTVWAERTAELGAATERNRIARETHDVVAHSLTVMVTLADAAGIGVRKNPGRAEELIAELSRTGRSALSDMRSVLTVLRDNEPSGLAIREPLITPDSIEKLLTGFRATGLPLEYKHTGAALPNDPAFRLTVYRIIQESLTNVLRYARLPGHVNVRINRDGTTVIIDVTDDGKGTDADISVPSHPRPADRSITGTGRGIAGMKERARIYNGTMSAGPMDGGGWRVHAQLTWKPATNSYDRTETA
ncbi:sensor histidine kinase [Arthrobacter sp. MMS24-S77]